MASGTLPRSGCHGAMPEHEWVLSAWVGQGLLESGDFSKSCEHLHIQDSIHLTRSSSAVCVSITLPLFHFAEHPVLAFSVMPPCPFKCCSLSQKLFCSSFLLVRHLIRPLCKTTLTPYLTHHTKSMPIPYPAITLQIYCILAFVSYALNNVFQLWHHY